MDPIDHYQALDDAADLNALAFLDGDRPDPAVELRLCLALHDMGWQMALDRLCRVHERRAAQYGARDWVAVHEAAAAHYLFRHESARAELGRLTEEPGVVDELDRARRAIALAAACSGTTPAGPLDASLRQFHDRGWRDGARAIATELLLWASVDEALWRREWTSGRSLSDLRCRQAPYLSYLWVTGMPAERDQIERRLEVALETALVTGPDEYRASLDLVDAVFADGLPDVLVRMIERHGH